MLNNLRKTAKILKDANNINLCNKILLIIAAKTGNINPRSDLSYSYIMRELRKSDNNKLHEFMQVFKKNFDEAYEEELENPEEIALLAAIKAIDYKD